MFQIINETKLYLNVLISQLLTRQLEFIYYTLILTDVLNILEI